MHTKPLHSTHYVEGVGWGGVGWKGDAWIAHCILLYTRADRHQHDLSSMSGEAQEEWMKVFRRIIHKLFNFLIKKINCLPKSCDELPLYCKVLKESYFKFCRLRNQSQRGIVHQYHRESKYNYIQNRFLIKNKRKAVIKNSDLEKYIWRSFLICV